MNGELRYALNDVDLGAGVKVDGNKEPYLLVQCRNQKSKAEIIYISELL